MNSPDNVNHRQVARALAGASSYDALSEQEQAIVRQIWAERMEVRRDELNYAKQFSAVGRLFSEAEDDGNVIMYLAAHRINDRLGAFYTTRRVRKVLGGISRQAVSQLVASKRLLRVTTADGEKLFPAFQFKGDRVLPGLQDLLRILLDSGADSWTVASWLTAGIGQLDGATALDVLHSGEVDQIAELKALAAEDAAGWRAAA